MELEKSFNWFTLIFSNNELEEEFLNMEKKALNSFALFSAYLLMVVGLIITTISFIIDEGKAQQFTTYDHVIMTLCTAIPLIFETLSFYVYILQRTRGFFLITGIYIILAEIAQKYNNLVPVFPLYFP